MATVIPMRLTWNDTVIKWMSWDEDLKRWILAAQYPTYAATPELTGNQASKTTSRNWRDLPDWRDREG